MDAALGEGFGLELDDALIRALLLNTNARKKAESSQYWGDGGENEPNGSNGDARKEQSQTHFVGAGMTFSNVTFSHSTFSNHVDVLNITYQCRHRNHERAAHESSGSGEADEDRS
ncbi:hypothetical protein VMCG_08448 [Cytospora schulzeri]|uniref:Uncharacterized protein n=1 Tax=Cytospora schulzeri TaxID=448051 RepID=A0A423VWT8_9PEZI|nr:hypothetical protein VMCG_08448 [Valsa malicola]